MTAPASTIPHATSSLRDRLRIETRSAHDALERRLPVVASRVTLEVYRDHLRYLLGFIEPLEQRIRGVHNLRARVTDIESRWKRDLLWRDLGADAPGPRADADHLPACRTVDQTIGVLYVIEGSTIGARMLEGRLREAGVLPGPVGSSFLRGYGRGHGRMWARYLGAIESTAVRARETVVRAAHETFAGLASWRDEWERRQPECPRP